MSKRRAFQRGSFDMTHLTMQDIIPLLFSLYNTVNKGPTLLSKEFLRLLDYFLSEIPIELNSFTAYLTHALLVSRNWKGSNNLAICCKALPRLSRSCIWNSTTTVHHPFPLKMRIRIRRERWIVLQNTVVFFSSLTCSLTACYYPFNFRSIVEHVGVDFSNLEFSYLLRMLFCLNHCLIGFEVSLFQSAIDLFAWSGKRHFFKILENPQINYSFLT